jgi:hypothetical protein
VIFIRTRHFSLMNDGLIFIGIGIGSILSTFVYLGSYTHTPVSCLNGTASRPQRSGFTWP